MRIFTLVADCKRTVIACLVLLCGLMMSEVGWGQTTQTFNASGSWFCPAGVTSITVECWGAGGSGGKRTSNGVAGGGGGGAYSMKVIPVSAGTTYTYTVGTGSNSTSPGGDSWFQSDATVMAKGGNSVADNSATRATGGAAASSIGTVRNNGGDGRNGNTTGTDYGGGGGSSAGVGIDGSDATDQNGATAPAGGGNGGNGRYNTQGDGLAGNIPGGGGGGALRTSSGTRNGGTGANGQIKITYTQLTYKSQINSINYGTSPWCAGKTRSVTVSITNVGTATWTDATPDINIGLKWDADPDYGSPPGNISRQNAGNLAPGATGTYIFPIVTPVIASGTDHLTADVVYEAISWFADNGGGVGPGNVKFVTPGITILAAPAAPTGFSSQSFCANANPTVADLLASGSNIQWYATASGGTTLATTTALVNGTHYYASQTNGSGCESSSRLDVVANIYTTLTGLSYSVTPAVYCTGAAIIGNNPTVTGGSATSYSISPALPAGLILNTNTGAITGIPTVVASAGDYVVTATNLCGSVQTTINITVIQGVSGLNYSATPVSYCVGNAITPNAVTGISGDGTITYSVSPALPAGLSINTNTGTITGTPTTASAATNYTVTASNGCSNTTRVLNITVLASVTSLSYTVQNPTYCTGNAITTNSPTSNGGGTKTYSISPALPSGLNFSTTTGAITGTPTAVAATAAYVVTVSNGCSSAQTTLNLTVLQGLSGLSYAATPVTYCTNFAITPNTVAGITGGGTITYSVSPALPAGLSISSSTGAISGTPTAASTAANYTITASNGCSNTTAVVNITVLSSVTSLSYTVQNPTYCTGNAIATNSPTSNGSGTKTYSISPALPSGLNFSTTTGAITGTPTAVAATAVYVVTVSNGCSSAQTTLNLTVLQGLSGLNYSATPVSYCVGNAITPNTVTGISGDGTITYSVSPALPAGLSINTNTGTITGTPTTASGATNYTVTAS
ncbi:MAG TPA: putative Ig domain-containing protein, partial [Parafilimonas sp.]|nr:putative Ig domain-containing protein [Parafilimonas sp.]